ncbi:DNA-directed DNA polymerase II small subunit [Candidatus Woesearchaeota archaeon]|nr:DNA-directed DNA polymerase II small subunit [Candidatus Woesearchaeota archaeon]
MQTLETKRKDIVNLFLRKGMLVSNDLLDYLEDEKNLYDFCKLVEEQKTENIAVLSKKIKDILAYQQKQDLPESENNETILGKQGVYINQAPNQVLSPGVGGGCVAEPCGAVKVIFSYNKAPKKREANDFVGYFNSRYQTIERILKQRQELQNMTSINRIIQKKDREQVSVTGMVRDKQYTKNGNCILTIEDKTGYIKVLVNKNKPDLFRTTKDVMLDEVIGVVGVNGNNIIFASNVLFPDIPLTQEPKKASDEAYALFLSDLHIGSKNFLREDFSRFLKWINSSLGNEQQKQIASKVKYIFILGDLVDGCGVYPGQEKELEIKDIKDQYKICADLLSEIPKGIQLVICPGNHDAMRLAEPQLPIYRDFAEPLYNLPNASMVSNPSMVNIHSSADFSGFDVLLYHGYSFDYYVAEAGSIRNQGGYDRADLLMKFLLQKRHLAPSYTSTLYVPDPKLDFMVVGKVPDFFVSGHIHKAAAANYKNITLISGSCWQSKTTFQEKVGHNPEPSRVPIVNLQTRHIKMMKFGK